MEHILFDLNPDPVIIFRKKTLGIINANPAFLEKYGYNRKEIEKLTLWDLWPKKKHEMYRTKLPLLSEEEIRLDEPVLHQTKCGEIFYVDVTARDFEYEGTPARIAVIHDVTDRIKAQKRSEKAYKELNHLVKSSPLAAIKWDLNFHIIEWSKRAAEITGYDRDEVVGKTPDYFDFTEEDRALIKSEINAVRAGEKDQSEFEVELIDKSGDLTYLRVYASVLRDEEGGLVSTLTLLEDVTEQKKTEHRYQRLFENANDGIFVMDHKYFIECNDEVLNLYGCTSRDQIIGKTPLDFSPEYQPDGERSSEKAYRKIEKALDGSSQVFEWEHKKLDGTTMPAEISLNRLELGEKFYLQAIVRDLTEQKKSQEKLKRSERLFRKLFLKAPGAMVMVDIDNKVQMVNRSFENLFGYSQEEVLNEDIDDFIVGEERDQPQPRMPVKGFEEGVFYTNVTRYTKEGKKLHLLLGAIPVYLDDEPIAGFGVYVDITEQKMYEKKLQQSIEEKQVLLEEIHHRVKNNLAIISGLLQMQAFESDNREIKEYLNESQLRIQSMALVHEMLYQSENFTGVSFEEYLQRLIEKIKNSLPFEHHHIDVKIDAEDVSLNINQAIPCAILINELITNAFKHAFPDREPGVIHVLIRNRDDDVILMVEDNGVGLPEQFIENKQTTIGMSLIQNLTRQLEGTLQTENDGGAKFTVQFKRTTPRVSGSFYLNEEE